MIRRLISENIKLVFKLENKTVKIKADSSQIEQIIINLIERIPRGLPRGQEESLKT